MLELGKGRRKGFYDKAFRHLFFQRKGRLAASFSNGLATAVKGVYRNGTYPTSIFWDGGA